MNCFFQIDISRAPIMSIAEDDRLVKFRYIVLA